MRLRISRLLFIALFVSGLFVARATAYPTFSASSAILSALKDTSNFESADTRFGFNFYNGTSDPNLYINQINFLPGAGYNANINLTSPGSTYETGFGSYTLGTPVAPDTVFFLHNAVQRSGSVDPSVANGVYNFSLQVLGGYNATANDLLGDISYQIEVASGINVSATATASPNKISAGQTTTVSVTLKNDDATRSFHTDSWYYNGGGMTNGTDSLSNGNFVGDWFNKSTDPGQSRTDLHTTWDATNATPLGDYTGSLGLIGGLYDGDEFSLRASNGPVVAVVAGTPEPASLGTIAVGAALFINRRRRV